MNIASVNKKRRFFLHFHNYEILKLYGIDVLDNKVLLNHSLLLTKYSLLISEEPLLIQPKYLFETKYFDEYQNIILPVIESGLVDYTGEAPNFEIEEKKTQYRNHDLISVYSDEKKYEEKITKLRKMRWNPRLLSSTLEISENWLHALETDDSSLSSIVRNRNIGFISSQKQITDFSSIPESLQGEAFILKNVNRNLKMKLNNREKLTINFHINKSFLLSYLKEYDASILVDTPLAYLDCGITNDQHHQYTISFRFFKKIFNYLGLTELIEEQLTWAELIKLRDSLGFSTLIDFIIRNPTGISIFEKLSIQILRNGFSYRYNNHKFILDEVHMYIYDICKQLNNICDFETDKTTKKHPKLPPKTVINFNEGVDMSNINKIDKMINSQIQQDSSGSSQSLNVNESKEDINNFLFYLKNNINKINLEVKLIQEIKADISTVESQMQSPQPKSVIIKESLKSMRNIIEGTTGGVIASGLLSQLASII